MSERTLIKDAIVLSIDPDIGELPRASILIEDGKIAAVGPNVTADGAKVIDATGDIVIPGFIDTHYHMWSALGRNFVGDGFGYFPAKNATSKLFTAEDFYASVTLGLAELANAGITTVHNWSHNTRTPAHADAELRAHRESMLRARYAYGHVDQMPRNEPLDFRNQLEVKYRDGLRRATVLTTVDREGDVVWTQEYLRYRVNSCGHGVAVQNVLTQIDGRPAPPVCR